MRTIMVMVRGILIRLRYMLQVLPVYTTLIWYVKPSSSAGQCFISHVTLFPIDLEKIKNNN